MTKRKRPMVLDSLSGKRVRLTSEEVKLKAKISFERAKMKPMEELLRKPETLRTNVRTVTITRELAARFSRMTPLPGDRELKERHSALLQMNIERIATPFLWSYSVLVNGRGCYVEGSERRGNGQHSSTLFMLYPEMIKAGMVAVVVEHCVLDTDDMRTVWLQYDPQVGVRSRQEAYMIEARAHSELDGLGLQAIGRAVEMLVKKTTGFQEFKSIPNEIRCGFIPDNLDFLVWLVEALKPTGITREALRVDHMIKSAFLDMIHEAWKLSPDEAREFVWKVRDPNTFGSDGPTLALHHALRYVRVSRDQPGDGGKRKQPSGIPRSGAWLTWATLKAWNTWQQDRTKSLNLLEPAEGEPGLVFDDGWVVDFDRNLVDIVFFPKTRAV